jgi:DNA (cytosine-5)-methyltransferase 1
VSLCLNAGAMGRIDAESETLIPIGGSFDRPIPIQNATRGEDQNGLGVGGEVMFTLDQASQHAVAAVAFDERQSDVVQYGEKSGPLDTDGHSVAIHSGMAVRRLTPRECCRLQGFPDDYLDITYRGKPAADGPKYRALGNSMAVPCMAWIGKRIQQVAKIR